MTGLRPGSRVPCPTRLLDPDEHAIWWDQPDPKRLASRGAASKILFFVFFVGFSVFWMAGASKSGGYFWMFGLLFFSVGMWGLSEPLRLYLKAPSTYYLLTDRRAVIATDKSIKSVAIRNIKLIELSRVTEALADVLFLDQEISDGDGGRQIVRDGFIGIADASAVEREMRRLQAII